MEITYPDKNPYKSKLAEKAKDAETVEEFEEVCAVLEYVDSVQVQATLRPELAEDDYEVAVDKVHEAHREAKAKVEDPKSILKEILRNIEKGDDDDGLAEVD